MEIELFTYDCTGCCECMAACRRNVLTLTDNGVRRFVNIKNKDMCAGCGRCERLCPNHAIQIKKTNKSISGLHSMKKKTKALNHIIEDTIILIMIITIFIW